jgi:hypothetical protein
MNSKTIFAHHRTMVAKYKRVYAQLNQELQDSIEALPDNPRITRLGKNCFTVSIQDLGSANWTSFYHDFKNQYSLLQAIIEKYPIDKSEKIFAKILTTGKYRLGKDITTWNGYSFRSGSTYYFHPDVIKYLKEIL